MKKVLALILSIVMALAVFVACNNNTPGSTQTSDNTTVWDNTVGSNTETSIETDKFDNINFDGATLSLSVRGNTWEEWVCGDEQGDVIYSSIYDANLAVDSFLNINRVINVGPEGQEEYAEQIATTIMAGLNTNDVVVTDMYYGTIYSTMGTYVNLKESTFGDYIDLEQDYWYREYIENTVVGNDQIFMLAGDISPSLLSWAGAIFFNYDKYESIIGDPDEFMRKVIAGEWYLNDLDTYCKTVYSDLDANQKTSKGDDLGLIISKGHSGCYWLLNCGMTFMTKNDEGRFDYVIDSERNYDIFEAVYNLYLNNEGVFVTTAGKNFKFESKFASGESLFYGAFFSTAWHEDVRNMKQAYAVIPYPKYDENQTSYISTMMDSAQLYAAPTDLPVEKHELVAAFLEAQCIENNKRVVPAIYETSLKNKYVSENVDLNLANQCVDLIRNSISVDFGFVYNTSLGYPVKEIATLIEVGDSDLTSQIASMDTVVRQNLGDIENLFLES